MKSLEVRAPTRIDFGGGWTDVPPYDVEVGGYVCNVAISRYATVRITPLPDVTSDATFEVARDADRPLLAAVARRYGIRGAALSLTNDFPVAAGLGGSSAAGVAAISASLHWMNQPLTRGEIAEASRALEVEELGIAGGRQDHYAAAFGGALGLRFGHRVDVDRIALSPHTIEALPKRCIVLYTGESRISANTITAVMTGYRSAASHVRGALKRMRDQAEQMVSAIRAGDIDALGHLVDEQWRDQRSLDPAIPTPLIDRMIDTAKKHGAIGCKALGASGGGCVLMIAAADRADEVRRSVSALGTEIAFRVDMDGVTVLQPAG